MDTRKKKKMKTKIKRKRKVKSKKCHGKLKLNKKQKLKMEDTFIFDTSAWSSSTIDVKISLFWTNGAAA